MRDAVVHLSIKIYEVKCPWWVRGNLNILAILWSFVLEFIALIKLDRILKQENIETVYTNSIVIFSGALIAYLNKKPHIWHIKEIINNNPDLHFFLPKNILFGFISKASDRIIAMSHAIAEQFKNKDEICIVNDGFAFEEFHSDNSEPDISALNSEDWPVAVVGSLQKRKAQDDAIRAIKIAKEKIPNIKLLVIGKGDKSFTQYLKKLAHELDLHETVIFTDHRDDIPNILSKCKVLLMPSWAEPFGLVVIEAMALGVPVIGTNSGGVREIIQNGITGYLVAPQSPGEIAQKIIHLYFEQDTARWMGSNSIKIVKEKFSVRNYVRKIEDILANV